MTEETRRSSAEPTQQGTYSDTLAERLGSAYDRHRDADPAQLRGGSTHRELGDLLYGHVPQIVEALRLMDAIIAKAQERGKRRCSPECPGDETCEMTKVCMCGADVEGHSVGSGHAPVSMHDFYSSPVTLEVSAEQPQPRSVVGVGPPVAWEAIDDDGTSVFTKNPSIAAVWRRAGVRKVRSLYVDAIVAGRESGDGPTLSETLEPASRVPPPHATVSPYSFQNRAYKWQVAMAGQVRGMDPTDRGRRFVEEALEFAQAIGIIQYDVDLIVKAVYGKPKGDPTAECGAALLTLAMAATTAGVQLLSAGEAELARVTAKLDAIREKDRMMQEQGLVVVPAPTREG